MSRTSLPKLSLAPAIALTLLVQRPSAAQAPFPEAEPDSSKAQATPALCLAPGDFLTGTTTGSVTGVGVGTPDSADYFLVRTCALPPGIYEHTLTLASATPGQTSSIRGLDQVGIPGLGGKPVLGTDAVAQPLIAGTNKWYGFGKSEQLYVRVEGTPATVAAYTHTLATNPILPTMLGVFTPGIISISAVGMGHATDTDLWVYDVNLDPIAGYGNDDTPIPLVAQSTLTRFYAPGVYYLAVASFNFANDLPSPGDDASVAGTVLDFPGAALSDSGGPGLALDFSITDAMGVTPVVTGLGAPPGDVQWFRFQVGGTMIQSCFPGLGGILPCPCGQPPNPAGGCANFGGGSTTGAVLTASGVPSLAADSVVLETSNHRPGSITNVFFTGSGALGTGFPSGAGVRCVSMSLRRLYTGQTSGGLLSKPGPGDPSVSARCIVVGVPIVAGDTRHYFNIYRDAAAAGPCGNTSSTVNVTNAGSITWAP